MTYIVHGATGAQGSPVVSHLLAHGKAVAAAVRTPEGLPDGVRSIAVANTDTAALAGLYRDAEGVFIHLPIAAPDELAAQVPALIAAVAQAGPRRVVVSTSGLVIDDPASPIAAAAGSPIRALIAGLEQTGVSLAVVAPRLFLENLLNPLIIGPAEEDGVLRYPVPPQLPVSWSSHNDVGEVIARLLIDTSITGIVGVGHLPGLVGADLAEGFAKHLGRSVSYEALTPAQFGDMIAPFVGDAVAGITGLYTGISASDANTIAESTSAQELLGLAPKSVADWLAEKRK